MAYSLEGDVRFVLTEEGSKFVFENGQALMDQGLENMALIALFTSPGWVGNSLFRDPNQRIGSDFERAALGTINLDRLTRIENAAKRALDNPAFGKVTVIVTNPVSHRIDVLIQIEPPGQDIQQLTIQKNGQNWIAQIYDPASGRINEG